MTNYETPETNIKTDTTDKAIDNTQGAVMRLAFAREQHPGLRLRLARANVALAAAIIAMDNAADIPGRHNFAEQVAFNDALEGYGQALADMLRGEKSD